LTFISLLIWDFRAAVETLWNALTAHPN
jgi:hypothetical protein